MNIEIASLIGSILAVTVSVGFTVAFRISLNKKITEINKTVNDFKTEVNHRFELLEVKINMINEKKK